MLRMDAPKRLKRAKERLRRITSCPARLRHDVAKHASGMTRNRGIALETMIAEVNSFTCRAG